VNGFTDALIGAAAADVLRHNGVDIGIARMGLVQQQRSGGHNHTGLTISTLRYVLFDPRALTWMVSISRKFRIGSDSILLIH
jgi:hypothetical protein